MSAIFYNLRWWMVSTLYIWLSFANATGTPQLTLQMNTGNTAGFIQDKTIIGQGRITFDGEHAGFYVWNETATQGLKSNSYIITGQGSDKNTLRVRIESEDEGHGRTDSNGFVIITSEDSTIFYVVIDGDQNVNPDSYALSLKSSTLIP